jgi:Uma2 family endonuclease
METATLVSVEEYLRTSYPDGDREYVDGRVVERNMGEFDHSHWQTRIAFYLLLHYKQYWSGVELRVQVKSTRFRVPDVTLIRGATPGTGVLTVPPLLVVEVLSRDDRAGDLQEKIDDYLAFGIPFVWVVNPRTQRGFIYTSEGMRQPSDGILRADEIELPLAEIFV